MTNPKPADYEYRDKWYTHYLNHGGEWQTMERTTVEGTGPDVFALVSADMAVRASVGMAEYGVPLRAFNGRDAMWDAYEEALDLAVYLRQCITERDLLASRGD